MHKSFSKAEWIWNSLNYRADEYAEFRFNFDGKSNKKTIINIASDSNYNLYVNGILVSFGQYADFPTYKVYDNIDITKFLVGDNLVEILVWYYGRDTQTYIIDKPGVIFEVVADNECIISSGVHIESRLSSKYAQHYEKLLTKQLGFSFKYFGKEMPSEEFCSSVIIDKSKNLFPRPNERLVLRDGEAVSKTILDDGSYLIDMGKETCGFLRLDFDSVIEQNIVIAYGQFLDNGTVKRHIGDMDFSVEYVAKQGENAYVNCFRRLSGRYLQIFTEQPIKIRYAGICSVDYPLVASNPNFKNQLRNQIYNISVRTLQNCMHEHYEDTPWREQALYTMDSRNEMLCTYYAFGDYKFARSNLVLISKGLREDGLLSICYPAGRDIPIPMFSLIYPVQVYEYIQYSGDKSIIYEVKEVLDVIVKTFERKIDSKLGLIPQFPYPCWNYYEWSDKSSNEEQIERKETDFYPTRYDLILNCMYLICLEHYRKICLLCGEEYKYNETLIRSSIKDTFYVKEKGLFKANDGEEEFFTALGNSLAVLAGLGNSQVVENMLATKEVVPITLSMSTFFYEALLSVDKEYAQYIVDDIDMRYGRMVEQGATTFWETEKGVSSLDHTGSLCHGWSAMPIYYYTLLNTKEYFNGKL